MSYLQDKKAKRERLLKFAAGALFVGVMFYFRAGIFHAVSSGAGTVFRPALLLGRSVAGGFGNLGAYFSLKSSLYKENEKLKEELAARNGARSDYEVLERENESLKKIIWRLPEERKLVLSAILSKPNRSPYDTLLIDIGSGAGLKAGDVVYAHGDVPIGRIAEAGTSTSKVVLFSSPGENTEVAAPAYQKEGEGIFWEITGRGGGDFEMILPRDFALNKGDTLSLPGLRARPLAEAVTILSDPRSPWKTALLQSPVNISELKFVQVEIR